MENDRQLKEIARVSETRGEIEKLIFDQPTTMSKYQIDNFVISDKMTDYKILKQILLELGTRYVGLDEMEIDIKIEKLTLKQMQETKGNMHKGIARDIHDLEMQKQENKIKQFEKSLRNTKYEIGIMEANYSKIKAVHENPQALLDDETGEEIYWVNKFIKEAQIDIMTGGRIGKGVLDAIMSLPEHLQQVIITQSISQAANNNGFISAAENTVIEKIKEKKEVQLMLNTIVGAKVEDLEIKEEIKEEVQEARVP